MNTIISFFRDYVAWLTIPDFTVTDVLEIAIIAFAFYHIILWIKDTRAWVLLKGMVILGIISFITFFLQVNVYIFTFVHFEKVIITQLGEFTKHLCNLRLELLLWNKWDRCHLGSAGTQV